MSTYTDSDVRHSLDNLDDLDTRFKGSKKFKKHKIYKKRWSPYKQNDCESSQGYRGGTVFDSKDGGTLVLKHSVLHVPLNFRDITRCVAELNSAFYLLTRAKKYKYKICLSFEWYSNSQPYGRCAAAPRWPQIADLKYLVSTYMSWFILNAEGILTS